MGLGGSGWMDGSVIEVFESLLSSPCGFPSQWMVAPSLQPVPLALSKVSSVPLKLAWAKGHLRSWGRKTVPGVGSLPFVSSALAPAHLGGGGWQSVWVPVPLCI